MTKRLLLAGLVSMAAVASGAACGSSGDSQFTDGNDAGGGNGDDGGGIITGSDGGFTGGGDSGKTTNGGDAGLNECAADTQQAKLAPLDLVLMQDTSGSMWEYIGTTGAAATTSKYTAVTTALDTFMADPSSAGIGLGIQFFPEFQSGIPNSCTSDSQCGSGNQCIQKACSISGNLCTTSCGSGQGTCTALQRCQGEQEFYCLSNSDCNTIYGDFRPCNRPIVRGTCTNEAISCTSADYQTLAASVAALPGAKTAIDTALAVHIPNGQTPTYNALDGALKAAKAYALAHSDDIVAVVLSTDGIPYTNGTCDDNTTDINNLAAAALAGTPSIKTFVIGVLSPSDNTTTATNTLNGIAAAGGTTAATIIGTSATTESDFVAALTKIRGQSLPCQFDLPVPEAGTPDYSKVNVVYTDSATGNASIVPYVADLADCSADGGVDGGWYYDKDPFVDAGTPSKVVLCPATCSTVQGDPTGKVDVVQGCKTTTTGGGPPR